VAIERRTPFAFPWTRLRGKRLACFEPAAISAIGTALIYLAFLPPLIINVDGNSMIAVAESLALRGTFAVPPGTPLSVVGSGGLHYSILYPLISIAAVPLVAIGSVLAAIFHLPSNYVASVAGVATNAIATSFCAYYTSLLASRLDADSRASTIAGLTFGFGTIAMVYARTFFADPILALITIVSIYYAADATDGGASIAAVGSMLAVLAKPSGIVVGPVLSTYLVVRDCRLRRAIRPVAGMVVGCGAYLAYNALRFGSVFVFRHEGAGTWQGFTMSTFPWSTLALVFSPGVGLLWYCPPVIALIFLTRRSLLRPETIAVVGIAGSYLLIYSVRADWHAGWSWGPRFLLPALPGLIALTAMVPEQKRLLVIFLAIAGFFVNAPNLISFYERFYQEQLLHSQVAAERSEMSLEDSPIVGIWKSAAHQIHDAAKTDVTEIVKDAGHTPLAGGRWVGARFGLSRCGGGYFLPRASHASQVR
jgi:hypothetical protein